MGTGEPFRLAPCPGQKLFYYSCPLNLGLKNHRYYLEGLRMGVRWVKILGDTQLIHVALADGLPSTPSLLFIEVCASQGVLSKMDLECLLQGLTPGPSCKLNGN